MSSTSAGCTGIACSIRHASYATGSTNASTFGSASRGPTRSKPHAVSMRWTPSGTATRSSVAPMRDSMPSSPVRSTISAFTRIRNRVSDVASCAPRPGAQSSHASSAPTRSRRKSTSSLPCGASSRLCTASPSASGSRSADTRACRNESVSGPVTVTNPRSERSTQAPPSRSAARSSANAVDGVMTDARRRRAARASVRPPRP